MFKKRFGFTFVELVVAVAILAILATIGFIAYTNQLGSSRDGRRISEITSINDSLQLLSSKGSKYPLPSSAVQVTTAGAIQGATSQFLIGYQGEFGADLLKQVGFQNGGFDPKDKFPYIYYTNRDRRQAQLMAYLEDGASLSTFNFLVPQAYAALADYSTRFPKVIGKPLGIVTENTTKRSIHDISSITSVGYFNINTTGTTYTVNLTDKDKLTGASVNLVNSLPNKSCKRIRDVGAANGDGTYKINPTGAGEIEVYCDMSRDGGGWTLVMKNDGDSDTGALLNSGGYNITHLLKNTFGLPSVFSAGSATLSNALISAIYTEQYRIENNFGTVIYAKFNPWTSYDANTGYSKLVGCSYNATANYTTASTNSSAGNKGFGVYDTVGGISPNRSLVNASKYGAYGAQTYSCGGTTHSGDDFNTKAKVWVR